MLNEKEDLKLIVYYSIMNKTYIRKNKTIKFNLRGEKYFEHTNSKLQ